jgi:hypothetical protein
LNYELREFLLIVNPGYGRLMAVYFIGAGAILERLVGDYFVIKEFGWQ